MKLFKLHNSKYFQGITIQILNYDMKLYDK